LDPLWLGAGIEALGWIAGFATVRGGAAGGMRQAAAVEGPVMTSKSLLDIVTSWAVGGRFFLGDFVGSSPETRKPPRKGGFGFLTRMRDS